MQRRAWIIIGILILLGIGGVAWASSSLLVLKAALPGSPQVVVGSIASGTVLEPFMSRVVQILLPSDIRAETEPLARWVYGSDHNSETVLGQTTGSGWEAIVYPWGTVLSRSNTVGTTLKELGELVGVIVDIAIGRVADAKPTLYVQLPGTPGPIAVSGQLENNMFRFTYNLTGEPPLAAIGSASAKGKDMGLNIALPSDSLALFPADVRSSIQNKVVSELGFTKTLPDVLSEFENSEAFGVRASETESRMTAIGVVQAGGAQKFTDALRDWVALERAYIMPVERAFSLPDGTIGYELIPAPGVESGFSLVGVDGCQTSYIESLQVWRCRKDDVATFGVAYNETRKLLDDLHALSTTGHWQVGLPHSFVASLSDTLGVKDARPIEYMTLVGDHDTMQGWGTLQFQ